MDKNVTIFFVRKYAFFSMREFIYQYYERCERKEW